MKWRSRHVVWLGWLVLVGVYALSFHLSGGDFGDGPGWVAVFGLLITVLMIFGSFIEWWTVDRKEKRKDTWKENRDDKWFGE